MTFARIRDFPRSASAQLMQSATSLCATLIFSQVLSPTQFGLLAIYWVVWTLILALNRAVFGEQLLASGSVSGDSRGYGALMLIWLGSLAAVTLGIVFATNTAVLLSGVAYIIFFVMADAVRYWALAQRSGNKSREESLLVRAELLRLVTCGVVLLFVLLDAEAFVMSWVAGLSSVYILASFPHAFRLSLTTAVKFLRSRRSFELIMLVQFLALNGSGQLVTLFTVPALGPAAYGALNLTNRLIAPVTVLGSAFQPALIKYFAAGDRAQAPKRLLRAVIAFLIAASVTMVVCYLAIRHSGHLFIDPAQLDGVLSLLWACLLGIGAVAVSQPGGALIRVWRLGRISLLGQSAGVLATVIGVLLAVRTGDIVTVAWALSLGTCVTVLVSYVLLIGYFVRQSAGGRTSNGGVLRHVGQDQRIGADETAPTHGHRPQNHAVRPEDAVLLDVGVLPTVRTGDDVAAPQDDSTHHGDICTDSTVVSYHDPDWMPQQKAGADDSSGINVRAMEKEIDARKESGNAW